MPGCVAVADGLDGCADCFEDRVFMSVVLVGGERLAWFFGVAVGEGVEKC